MLAECLAENQALTKVGLKEYLMVEKMVVLKAFQTVDCLVVRKEELMVECSAVKLVEILVGYLVVYQDKMRVVIKVDQKVVKQVEQKAD